jgi:hypothetical protein
VAVDATSVYWLNDPEWGGGVMKGTARRRSYDHARSRYERYWNDGPSFLLSVPLDGGTPTTLATGVGPGLAVDASSVYCATRTGDGAMKLPLAGGTPTTLASVPGGVWNLALYAGYVYGIGPRRVVKIPVDGGAVTTLVSGALGEMGTSPPIAVDATNVYWSGSSIMSVPQNGGAPTTLLAGDTQTP